MFNRNYTSALEDITGRVKLEDGLPKALCGRCRTHLDVTKVTWSELANTRLKVKKMCPHNTQSAAQRGTRSSRVCLH